MKRTRQILLFSLLVLFTFNTHAQQGQFGKVGGIEIGAGMNFFGPQSQMSKLLDEYGFNDDILDWVHKTAEEFPSYFPMGISFSLAYLHNIKPESQIGLDLQYSGFSKVKGYSDLYGDLDIRFSSIYVAPTYTRKVLPYLEIQAGIPLMVNIGRKTSLYDENVDESADSYIKFSAGLLAGINFILWDGMDTYGKIGANYILSIPVNMGPYSAYYGFDRNRTIPESKINFNHMNVMFTLGFHLWRLYDQ